MQKARLLAKDGDFARSRAELRACEGSGSKAESEAREMLPLVDAAVGEAERARRARDARAWGQCVDHASKALEVGTNSIELRELRLGCEEEAGDVDGVYGDLTWVITRRGGDVLTLQPIGRAQAVR
jgi:DnaJ family protein C protein 3